MEFKSENQKLREQIPMSNRELYYWLDTRRINFGTDSAYRPWLTYEQLKFIVGSLDF